MSLTRAHTLASLITYHPEYLMKFVPAPLLASLLQMVPREKRESAFRHLPECVSKFVGLFMPVAMPESVDEEEVTTWVRLSVLTSAFTTENDSVIKLALAHVPAYVIANVLARYADITTKSVPAPLLASLLQTVPPRMRETEYKYLHPTVSAYVSEFMDMTMPEPHLTNTNRRALSLSSTLVYRSDDDINQQVLSHMVAYMITHLTQSVVKYVPGPIVASLLNTVTGSMRISVFKDLPALVREYVNEFMPEPMPSANVHASTLASSTLACALTCFAPVNDLASFLARVMLCTSEHLHSPSRE